MLVETSVCFALERLYWQLSHWLSSAAKVQLQPFCALLLRARNLPLLSDDMSVSMYSFIDSTCKTLYSLRMLRAAAVISASMQALQNLISSARCTLKHVSHQGST